MQDRPNSVRDSGGHIQVMLFMAHAQDHLTDAMVIRDMDTEFEELYKKISG